MKSLLFVKVGAIGDAIMAFPATQYLRDKKNQITWVCGQSIFDLVKDHSGAQEVIPIDDGALFGKNPLLKMGVILKANQKLVGKAFDAIYIAHSDSRYGLLCALARGPRHYFHPRKDVHHTLEYLKFVGFEGEYKSNPQKLRFASKKIALAPGGAKNLLRDDDLRRWPLSHYVLLCKYLVDQGYEVEIVGADSDRWILPDFEGLPITSRLGNWKLKEVPQELQKFGALVTHDTGLLHLGGLAGVPVVGLFGPTDPSWRFPIGNSGVGMKRPDPLPCQPCYDGKNYAACSDNQCLKGLKVQDVLKEIQNIVGRA